MIELNIPGRGIIQLEQLVSDVNDTLAVDGRLAPWVKGAFTRLEDRLHLHLLTADTLIQGKARDILCMVDRHRRTGKCPLGDYPPGIQNRMRLSMWEVRAPAPL